jgi:hypothetical protein
VLAAAQDLSAPPTTAVANLFDGRFTAPSNEAFDATLRSQDPAWGVRDVRDLEVEAKGRGLMLERVVDMPANNHTLLFVRAGSHGAR